MGIPDKIKAIQEEIHKTQINKSTEFHVGLLKAKIAKLKKELRENKHGNALSGGKENEGFDVRKTGDASVVLIGLPSVGKSTLLNSLTNAKSRVAAYEFTTLTAIPGMMEILGAKIQVLDLPGIVEGAAKGRGMGKRVLSVARNADLVLTILDVFQPQQIKVLHRELGEIGIKVDKKPPDVRIEKSNSGGLAIQILSRIKLSESLIREILRINGIHNGRVVIREPGLTDEDLIDLVSGNIVYLPSLPILNKIDLVPKKIVDKLKSDFGFMPVSADRNINIDSLKKAIYEKLDFIRIYLKPRGGKADFDEPLIMKRNCTVLDVCNKIHRNFVRNFRYANVMGTSVKFDQQKVGLDHVLENNDVVTIMTR